MGLDLVELVLYVEDEFKIVLPDEDIEKVLTPNDLAEYVFVHFDMPNKKCSSQVSFYKLRKILMDNFNYKREELTLNSDLQKLLGGDIRAKWKKLDTLLEGKITDKGLYLREKENISFTMISLGLFVGLYFVTQAFWESLVFMLVLMVVSHFYIQKYFGSQLGYRYKVLSSLLGAVSDNRLDLYDSKKRILDKVISMSSEILNIPMNEIKANSHYVNDLGAG
jgi:acyl carrier protein